VRSRLPDDLGAAKAVNLSHPFLSDEGDAARIPSSDLPRMLYCPLSSPDGCAGWLILIMPQWATIRNEDIDATWTFAKQAALAMDLVPEDKQADSLARLGDQRRQLTRSEVFLRRYQGFVYRIARRFTFPGAEIEDVLQEGRIGLLKAIRSYDPLRGLSFDEFANLCIRNEIQAAFRRAARQNQVLTVPLESENSHVDVADSELSPEERCCAKASREGIVSLVCSRLHGMERDVFLLYLEGLAPSEICSRLRLTSKQVDNAFQRAKKRLRRAVVDGNLRRDHVTFNVEEIMSARVA
jgi:RNA polymerase sporulation-specific sigma factor